MKSIPLALTWEFWRQASSSLAATVACLLGLLAFCYGGGQSGTFRLSDPATIAALQLFGFIFVTTGLSAAICRSSGSPQFRFTLPVSTHTSILIPMINGAIATAIGYLTIALVVNWMFDAQWTLLKPTITAVSMITLCQAVGWTSGVSANLRGLLDACFCALLGIGVAALNEPNSREAFDPAWHRLRPLDVTLAVYVSLFAYVLAFIALSRARRGQLISMSIIGRVLLTKLELRFSPGVSGPSPMSAELWSDWAARGRLTLAGPLLIAITMCGFFLSGRFKWDSALDAIIGMTWLQAVIGSVLLGLFIGHVGERFDFHEFTATRPLSDSQLADVKLLNALRNVCLIWIVWAAGVVIMVACLTLVRQGPQSSSNFLPFETTRFDAIVILVMMLLCSWTLTSLAVSIAILRPWLVRTVFYAIALLPGLPFAFQYFFPEAGNEISLASAWGWMCLTIGGTLALYATALRLRLITVKRIAVVGLAYGLVCAAGLSLAGFQSPRDISLSLTAGFVLSSCILPFVCLAAVPVAIWWNRHR